MTALPQPQSPQPPSHPLTIDEYAALGEDEHGRTELQEGSLVMSPSPTPNHMITSMHLAMQLLPQVPGDLQVIPDIDVDLGLVPRDQPGSARRPDLIVVKRTEVERVEAEGGILRASELILVVEIVSLGSRRIDNVIKRHEYADAGIPHYWIVDIERPVSLVACHLTEEFGYQDSGAVSGTWDTADPFAARIDLAELH
ncbi:MAG: Uma2 family endonuclease [Pseudonocardiaceae bacterium]|nr:Uma2 family endonuclease [Pseudonocardiaceae bacterium]